MKTSCCHSKSIHRTEKGVICLNPACGNYLAVTSCYREAGNWKLPFVAAFFSFLFLFSFDDFSMENKEQKLQIIPEIKEVPLTIENLHSELINQNIICPEHVLAQIRLESGNLTSYLLQVTNNMMGMRYPLNRKTTACGMYIPSRKELIIGTRETLKKYLKTENYAVYKTWKDGIADYKLWQESNFNLTERYLTFLGKIYAKDSQYVEKIKQMAASKE